MKPNSNLSVTTPRSRPGTIAWWGWLGAVWLLTAGWLPAQVVYTPVFTNVWSIPSGTYADLPIAGNNVRGLAISPVTTNIVFASTTGGTNGSGNNHFSTLAFTNGNTFLGQGVANGIASGTLALDQARVSDDGFVYAANLSGAAASNFKIYRWPADTDFVSAATVVYDSGSGTSFTWRAGDYMDLRGASNNTEIAVSGNGSGTALTTNIVIFRPTDATATVFTNFSFTIPGGANVCGGGVTFDGTNNAVFVKAANGKTVYRVAYFPSGNISTGQITATFAMDQSANNGLKYFSANGVRMIASVCTATTALTNGIQHYAKVLQLDAVSSNAVVVLNQPLPTPNQANGNGLGLVDYKNGYVVFGEPNNGFALYQLGFITNSPPTVTITSSGGTVVAGYNYSFTAAASGSTPLAYQWYYRGTVTNRIAGATTNSYSLTPVSFTNAGSYYVVVTNVYGSVTSSVSTISTLPYGASPLTTPLWSLAPGSRPYLNNAEQQRGIAVDPVTGNVLVVSRSQTNAVQLLDATTGADLGGLDMSLFYNYSPPGTFAVNMVGVGDDGVVYVGNLMTGSGSDTTFAIYTWPTATTDAVQSYVYNGTPGDGTVRIGDTMAVRGAGLNTEILCSFRSGTNVALFTTQDGSSFNPTIIAITNLPAGAQANGFAGLGLAFGAGNTFWAKSQGFDLRQVAYDPVGGTGSVIVDTTNVPNSEAPIGVDPADGYLAAIGVSEIPQNLAIYDLNAGPALIDRKVFPANNVNANGVGAVAFDVAHGRIFALDTDNGVIALAYAGKLNIQTLAGQQVLSWPVTAATLQATTNLLVPFTDVAGATSPYTNTTGKAQFFRLRR